MHYSCHKNTAIPVVKLIATQMTNIITSATIDR